MSDTKTDSSHTLLLITHCHLVKGVTRITHVHKNLYTTQVLLITKTIFLKVKRDFKFKSSYEIPGFYLIFCNLLAQKAIFDAYKALFFYN